MMKIIGYVSVAIMGLAVLGYVGASDYENAVDQDSTYCKMVKMNKMDPSTGWPDYNKNYDEICNCN